MDDFHIVPKLLPKPHPDTGRDSGDDVEVVLTIAGSLRYQGCLMRNQMKKP